MPFVPAPNIVQVELRYTKDSQKIENRIHVNVFHKPTDSDLLAIATALTPIINSTATKALVPSDVTFTEFHQRSLHLQNDIERTDSYGAGVVGTATGEPLPNNNTICASLRSLFTGRSARGRLYWPGLSIDQVVSNHVNGTVLNSIQAQLRAVRNALTSASFAWTIVSYQSGGAPRVGGPVYFEVNDITFVNDIVDSQRRRTVGVGQ